MGTRRVLFSQTAVVFASALWLLSAATPAMACEGGATIFADQFSDDAGGWALNPAVKVGDGNFTFALQPDGMQANLNISHTVQGDVDICADGVWPTADTGILGEGVLFWGQDAKNYFQFGILNTGKYWIARKRDGEWEVVVQNVPADAIKTGPGDTNTLRVDASGNVADFYINGTKIRELRGQEPQGGWRFGLSGDNFDKKDGADVTFSSVTVMD
jgi:hypothetical protein